jgi:hypothetical protein
MRDSNSRGVAPNTLSNSAAWRSPAFTTVRGLREHERVTTGERRRTGVNETKTETGPTGLAWPAGIRAAGG